MDGSRLVILLLVILRVFSEGHMVHYDQIWVLTVYFPSAIVDRKKELIKYKGWQGAYLLPSIYTGPRLSQIH